MGTITRIINGQEYKFEATRELELAHKLVACSSDTLEFSFKRADTLRVDIFARYFDAYNKTNPYAKPYNSNKVNNYLCSLYFNYSGNIVTYRSEIPDDLQLSVSPQVIKLLADRDVVIIKAVRAKKFYTIYKISAGRLKWLLRDCETNCVHIPVDKKYFKCISYEKIKLKRKR